MSLHTRLLELLSTPAARAASEDDTRRAVAQLLGYEPATPLDDPGFSLSQLKRRRERLNRRMVHLQARVATRRRTGLCYDTAEASALQTAIALLDAAIAAATTLCASDVPATCQTCGDFEARAWWRWAEIELGDDSVRTATDQQLRRALTQKIEDQAQALDVMTERLSNLEHTVAVMAQAAHEGDLDQLRMHYEHAMGPTPDLSVEVTRG